MNKSRLLQALWLLLLSLVCVLMFYYRRESTKYPQEILAQESAVSYSPLCGYLSL